MVKHDLGSGALLHEFELRNRIDAGRPAASSPGLDDSLVRHEFDVSSRDVAAEELERALSLIHISVIVRSGQEPVVVNLDIPSPEDAPQSVDGFE